MQDTAFADIELTDQDFTDIAAMVRDSSGIVLTEVKRELVYSRLRRRLRALNVGSFAAYRAMLRDAGGEQERERMINAITTNLTGFFREPHHFDFLRTQLLPRLAAGSRRIRIWSAGCSSGEEPYSIAMTLRQAVPDLAQYDARILATDIDTDMVAAGKAGIYAAEKLRSIPAEYRHGCTQTAQGTLRMDDGLRRLIAFRPLNLLGPWPMRGPFDIIFCRNVAIYFDKPTQMRLIDRFAGMLTPDGHLFVGHSESLHNATTRFRHLGRTIHRRVA